MVPAIRVLHCAMDVLLNLSSDPRLPGVNVSPHSPQQAQLHGHVACVVTQGPTLKGPVLGIMLCHHHFEILDNLCTRGYTFSCCCGPFKR